MKKLIPVILISLFFYVHCWGFEEGDVITNGIENRKVLYKVTRYLLNVPEMYLLSTNMNHSEAWTWKTEEELRSYKKTRKINNIEIIVQCPFCYKYHYIKEEHEKTN